MKTLHAPDLVRATSRSSWNGFAGVFSRWIRGALRSGSGWFRERQFFKAFKKGVNNASERNQRSKDNPSRRNLQDSNSDWDGTDEGPKRREENKLCNGSNRTSVSVDSLSRQRVSSIFRHKLKVTEITFLRKYQGDHSVRPSRLSVSCCEFSRVRVPRFYPFFG